MARTDLAGLRARVLSLADLPSGGFVPNTQLDDFINDSYEALYEKLIAIHEPYFETTAALAIVGSTSEYALPADFFKLNGVDILISGSTQNEFYSVRRYGNAERNRFSGRLPSGLRDIEALRYMLRGSNIVFTPSPNQAYTGRILYAPQVTVLVADADLLATGMISGWSRWIVVDAAIKCVIKGEQDIKDLAFERSVIEKSMMESAENRDANEPVHVVDVRYSGGGELDRLEDW